MRDRGPASVGAGPAPVTTEPHRVTGPTPGAPEWRAAVESANVPTLLMVLVQLTGDRRWLQDPYRPKRAPGLGDNDSGGLPEEVQSEIREAALVALQDWRDGREPAIPAPTPELLVEMLSVSMGEPVPSEYGPMLSADLGLGVDAGVPQEAIPLPSDGFSAIVIGAGISGLCAGVMLGQAGIPYTIIEKNDTVGGTWFENRYPGAGVDTPSHLYSFSFAAHDWERHFALRDEIHAYLEGVAKDFDVTPHVRLATEAVVAAYDEQHQRWSVEVRAADGRSETLDANVLISAVGAFNPPAVPEIEGLSDFDAPWVHTAAWPADLDLSGKRVSVIGNGASAMQVVPAIADEVQSLTVFQRTPQWAAPFEQFGQDIPNGHRLLLREVPLYRRWYRQRLAWTFNDRNHGALQKDPTWSHPDRSVSAVNDRHREYFTAYVRSELDGHEELLPDVLPAYPPFGKRILLDNGWYRTLTRDHVQLVTEPVQELRGKQVITSSGAAYDTDVLVFATGFNVSQFLSTVDVRGRDGRSLEEAWSGDDCRAYLGTTVPEFPNLFILYGPNTQPGHGGSLIFAIEAQMHYVLDLLRKSLLEGAGAVECLPEVYDRYGEAVDDAHERMVWTHQGMGTYYRNSKGRVVVPTPFRVVDFWSMTREADVEHYVVEPAK